MFHEINNPAIGGTPIYGNPHIIINTINFERNIDCDRIAMVIIIIYIYYMVVI